jgi:hypothetical protein
MFRVSRHTGEVFAHMKMRPSLLFAMLISTPGCIVVGGYTVLMDGSFRPADSYLHRSHTAVRVLSAQATLLTMGNHSNRNRLPRMHRNVFDEVTTVDSSLRRSGEEKENLSDILSVVGRTCRVGVIDSEGTQHTAEVTADSL